MTLYIALLRLLHVGGGVLWAGAILFISFFLMPTVRALGPDGGRFVQSMGQVTKLSRILPGSALTTIIAGALLYWEVSGGLNPAWLVTPAGITLSLGALAALRAFFGPASALAKGQKRTLALMQGIAGRAPNEAEARELKELQAKVPGRYRELTVLMILAVLCMALFRVI